MDLNRIICVRIGGSLKQPSMASDLRMPEEDSESMADYADGVGDGEWSSFQTPLQ